MNKNILKILLVLIIISFTNYSYSQLVSLPPNSNFYDYMEVFYNSSKNDPNDDTEGGDVAVHRRLNLVWGSRLYPHGDFSVANQAIVDYATNYTAVDNVSDNANWICIGPSDNPDYSTNTRGVGQIHRITFDPYYGISNQTIYACSGYGGLWRTEDDGMHWTIANTDQLPISGVADIAINQSNNNMLFLASGLPDGGVDIAYGPNMASVNPIFTLGVYRSLDYGNTWNSMNSGQMTDFINQGGVIRKLEIDKNDPNNLFAATTDGVYRTQNASTSNPIWTKVLGNGDFKNIKFKHGNSNVIYASSDDVFISNNGGSSWNTMTGPGTGLDFNTLLDFYPYRINIAISPAAPDFLYAYIYGFTDTDKERVYIYYYNGNQWNQIHVYSPSNGSSISKSWIAIAASPVNPYSVFFYKGGVYGTENFLTLPIIKYGSYIDDGIYADNHVLEFQPNTVSNPKLFMGHHGGVSVGNMSSIENWEFRNNGLQNMLHWSFDDSEFENDVIITANQDCFNYIFENEWKAIQGGGDSYVARSSKVNSDLFFLSNGVRSIQPPYYQNFDGYLKSTNDTSQEYKKIPVDLLSNNCTYITKTAKSISFPNDNFDYLTFSEVYKRKIDIPDSLTTSEELWEIDSDIAKTITPSWKRQITEIDFCQSDPNVIYLATVGEFNEIGTGWAPKLFKTTVGGNNGDYFNIAGYEELDYPGINSSDFPVISGIAVHPTDPNKVWITMIGYDNISTRVAYSANGGSTWVNADPTNSLPELPVNNIVYQYGSDDALYIATDVGVFYKTSSMSNWERYGEFPHVRVNELKINYCQGKLRAATFGRSVWEGELLPMEPIIGYIISNGETLTWEKQKAIQTSIKIEDGGMLVVKDLVSMPINSKIIVQPGGQLIVDGGTITNACGDFWQGIVVIGQQNQPQTIQYQGSVRLTNGATIENAICGIQLFDRQSDGEPIPTTAGGYLLATDSYFKNNQKAIRAGYYNNSGSIVMNCEFTIDADYYSKTQTQPIFADFHEINQFGFRGNSFINSVTDLSISTSVLPIGIRSYNTGLQIKGSNVFENLQYGVKATEINFSNVSEISSNTFTKNLTGIYMSGVSAPQIFFNSFEAIPFNTGLPIDQTFTGVYLDGVQGHSVEENTFYSDLSGIPDKQQPSIGLVVNNGGTQDVEVYKNIFHHLDFAILAQNNNRSSNGLNGLCIKCNDFNYNGSDISVTAGPLIPATLAGIAVNQGSGAADDNAPAGNLFSNLNSNLQWQFNNLTGVNQQITYWHHNSPPRTIPDLNLINNVLLQENIYANFNNACQSKQVGGGGGGIGKTEAMALLNNSQSEFESTESTLFSLTDDGNTEALQTEVITASPNESYELRNELLDVAPYTSEDVLIDATEKEDVLNNALIRDVLVANPQAAKSEAVLTAIDDRSTAMPQYMKDQIASGASQVSEKEELEAKSFYFKTSYTNALNDLLFIYLSDTTLSNPMDSVIYQLESANYLYAKYQLANIYLSLNEFEQLNTTLTAIPENYSLKDELLTEYEQICEYFALMVNLKNQNRNIYQLTESEIVDLNYWYENESNLASIFALNILRQRGNMEYQEPYIFPDDDLKSGSIQLQNENRFSSIQSENLRVYPNPANDYLVCEYQLLEAYDHATISIVQSGSAKSLYTKTLENQQDALVIDLTSFKSGNYILMLIAEGKAIQTVSINIIK